MVDSFLTYLFRNPVGSNQLGTANVLPGVLTTFSNLLGIYGNETQYSLYKQQGQQYITAAKENAELIKQQGEIALRNLEYKNKLGRGQDVVAVAARGGNMSGSNLDVMVQQEKVRKMNENVLKGNYANQAMLELSNGYRQAASVYGQLRAKASSDKWATWASIFKGVEVYIDSAVKDAKVSAQIQQYSNKLDDLNDISIKYLKRRYGQQDSSMGYNVIDEGNTSIFNTQSLSLTPGESPVSDSLSQSILNTDSANSASNNLYIGIY